MINCIFKVLGYLTAVFSKMSKGLASTALDIWFLGVVFFPVYP